MATTVVVAYSKDQWDELCDYVNASPAWKGYWSSYGTSCGNTGMRLTSDEGAGSYADKNYWEKKTPNYYIIDFDDWLSQKHLSSIKSNKQENMDTNKFYKVLKDTPGIDAGAIIKFDMSSTYVPIDALYTRTDPAFGVAKTLVEAEVNKDFFLRVYPVTIDGVVKYLPKDEARKAQK